MRLLVILAIFAIGCAEDITKPFKLYSQEPEILPYLNYIENYYGKRFQGDVIFDDESINTNGQCHIRQNRYWMTIDRAKWGYFSEEQKWALIVHEYAHCVLHKQHLDLNLPDGCPSSIMNTYLVNTWCYQKHAVKYWEDLR